MQTSQLIHFLDAAHGSVSKLNNELALLIGYTRILNESPDDKRKAIWYDPQGQEVKKMPDFTGSIDWATSFLHALIPSSAVALAWREDGFFAVIDNQDPVKGNTLALALCKAAILIRIKLDK